MDDEDFQDLFGEFDLDGSDSFESPSHDLSINEAAELALNSDSFDEEHFVRADSELLAPSHVNESSESESLSRVDRDVSDPVESVTSSTDVARDTRPVIDKIEEMFRQIHSDLSYNRNELAVNVKTRRTVSDKNTPLRSRRICFPGKTAGEAWRFTVIVRVLELVHEALRTDTVLSKRDIYYRDPALFGKQSIVDRYIDDIALTFDVPRARLNVSAAAKGLIVGAMTFTTRDGGTIPPSTDKEGTLVPNLRDILCVDMQAIKWILVVEKEASFRSIANSAFMQHTLTNGVMMTGKGYPDIATRALLHFMSTPTPRNGFQDPPVYGLVDFDPDGLAILSVYKHGSIALEHENADLKMPNMQWLGLRLEDGRIENGNVHSEQGLMTLTLRDRVKAVKMLQRNANLEDRADEIEALQKMLMFNLKAELQMLDSTTDGMLNLLESKLCEK